MQETATIQKATEFKEMVVLWFMGSGRQYPWRETHDAFKILVAEMLMKLTGAWKAEQAYRDIIECYGNPALMAQADMAKLAAFFKPLGLSSRATLLIEMSRELTERFDGKVPKTYEELIGLPGVGQYTANAVLCLAYGARVPLVDGSVSRLFRRCFGFSTKKPAYADRELWKLAEDFLPDHNYREYNLGILDIAALFCKSTRPRCGECPIATICSGKEAFSSTTTREYGCR